MMRIDRRGFVARGVATAVGAVASAWGHDQPAPAVIDGLTVLDYGRSFVCGTADFNNVRFWVESRTVLIDGDESYECLQFRSCKSEHTFAERDLFMEDESPIDSLRLAFVAFNAPHFADFVIEQPTAVLEDGEERCRVFHYSNPISLPAKNSLLAVLD
jgi:hypothetical protein